MLSAVGVGTMVYALFSPDIQLQHSSSAANSQDDSLPRERFALTPSLMPTPDGVFGALKGTY